MPARKAYVSVQSTPCEVVWTYVKHSSKERNYEKNVVLPPQGIDELVTSTESRGCESRPWTRGKEGIATYRQHSSAHLAKHFGAQNWDPELCELQWGHLTYMSQWDLPQARQCWKHLPAHQCHPPQFRFLWWWSLYLTCLGWASEGDAWETPKLCLCRSLTTHKGW